jgi:hypothetical protein
MISPVRINWDGLTTVDIDPSVETDVLWDLNNVPLPFADNSVDEIHAYNVLEHIGTQGDFRFFFKQFEDFWRMLKPGGFVCAIVPDFATMWTFGDPGHTRVINFGTLHFLNQKSYDEVGTTSMTDYRWCYKGNLSIFHCKVDNGNFYFILEAIK